MTPAQTILAREVCSICGSTEHVGLFKCPVAKERLSNVPDPYSPENVERMNAEWIAFANAESLREMGTDGAS